MIACRKCGKHIIFCLTKEGKQIPVNWSSITADDAVHNYEYTRNFRQDQLPYRHGEHISHFATCPAADEFRKTKRNKAKMTSDNGSANKQQAVQSVGTVQNVQEKH